MTQRDPSHAWGIALLAVCAVAVAVRLPGFANDLGHTPLDIDEQRVAANVRHYFLTGEVRHRHIEQYPGVVFWLFSASSLLFFVRALMNGIVTAANDLPLETFARAARLANIWVAAASVGMTGRSAGEYRERQLRYLAHCWLPSCRCRSNPQSWFEMMLEWCWPSSQQHTPRWHITTPESSLGSPRPECSPALRRALKHCGFHPCAGIDCGFVGVAAPETGARRSSRGARVWIDYRRLTSLHLGRLPEFLKPGRSAARIHRPWPHLVHWRAGVVLRNDARNSRAGVADGSAGGSLHRICACDPEAETLDIHQFPSHIHVVHDTARSPGCALGVSAGPLRGGCWRRCSARVPCARAALLPSTLEAHVRRRLGHLAAALAMVTVIWQPLWTGAVSFSRKVSRPTHELAETWIRDNAKPGTVVLLERGWLDLSQTQVVARRVARLSVMLDGDIEKLDGCDWIVVPEPVFGHRALRQFGFLQKFHADRSFGGNLGLDFEVYALPDVGTTSDCREGRLTGSVK